MTKHRGFTLIELVITVAIAAILITLAVPSFSTMIKNNRRAAAVNELVVDINFARSEAVKRGSRVSLCRTSDYAAAVPTCLAGSGWEQGWIVFDDEDGNREPNSAADVLRSHPPLSNNITIRGSTPSADSLGNRIQYAASGRLAAVGNGTLVLCDDRSAGPEAREVIVANTGRVRTSTGTTNCTP